MTPQEKAAFFTIHRDLVREGPGLPEDVHWALDHLDLSGAVAVLDAACGPGADTLTLAQALPEATIEAVETVPHFVEEARTRLADHAARVTVTARDMRTCAGPYDLIWCAGALYFLGVTEGLLGWRNALTDKGCVVFSEPVLQTTPASDAVTVFWDAYPQITDMAGIEARVAAAGYRVHASRLIVGAPWLAYYDPMQVRMDALRAQAPDAELSEALAEAQLEIDRWRAAPDDIAYALLIVSPI